MLSGHGANPIFFNNKNKDWTFRIIANPHHPTSDNISFLPYLGVSFMLPKIISFFRAVGSFFMLVG